MDNLGTRALARSRRTARDRVAPASQTFDNSHVERAYARWAPVYDLVFGQVFERGRLAAIAAAEKVGGRILEASSAEQIFARPAHPYTAALIAGHGRFGSSAVP